MLVCIITLSPKLLLSLTEHLSLSAQMGAKVDARVELVKDEYLVLSLPEHKHAIGFAAAQDLDAPSASVHKRFALGSLQPCTVAVLPCAETGELLTKFCYLYQAGLLGKQRH